MKKILAILLTVCMVVCMIPGAAFAADPVNTGEGGTVPSSGPIDLSSAVITIDKDYYTAEELKAENFLTTYTEIKVKNESNQEIEKENYVITKTKNGDKIRITINFVEGKSTGTTFKDFDVVSEVLNNTNYFISSDSNSKTATALISDQAYTGADIKPTVYLYKKVTGKDGTTMSNELISSSKYTVEYSNNKNVGNAEIFVKGKGTVTGSIGGAFAITQANFSDVTITAPDTKDKTVGNYKVTAKLNGNILEMGSDKDYTLSFKNNKGEEISGTFEKGSYTVIVTPTKKNFTENSVAKTYSFDVFDDFNGGQLTIGTEKTFIYNGNKQAPTVTVTKDSKQVAVGDGYNVTYYDAADKPVVNPIDAGNYKLVVEAKEGNTYGFTGRTEENFTIKPVIVQTNSSQANYVYMDNITEQKYTGAALKPAVAVYYQADSKTAKKTLVKDKDYTVTYTNNISVGIGKAIVSFKGNYIASSDLTKTFIISKGTLLTAANTIISGVNDTYDYTGYAIKPTVYVTYRSGYTSKALTQSTTTRTYDYKVDYSSNIAAGTATITVTGQGEYTGTVTKTFKIKYNLSNATVTATPSTYLYDGKEKKPLVSVKVGYMIVPASNYNVVYSNNTNTGTAAVTVTANKYGNAIGSNSTYFTIKGKDGVITPEYAEYSKKTTKSKPFAIKIVSNTTDGTGYSYVSSDTSVATVSANGTVTPVGCGRTVITITTTGNRAYNPATATVTVTVKPTKGIISSLKSTAKGKLTVRYKKQSPNADYYQIRYGRAGDYTTKTIKNTTALTGKSTIKGLQSGKKYFIKVRGVKVLEDGTRLYGTWSVTKNAVTK